MKNQILKNKNFDQIFAEKTKDEDLSFFQQEVIKHLAQELLQKVTEKNLTDQKISDAIDLAHSSNLKEDFNTFQQMIRPGEAIEDLPSVFAKENSQKLRSFIISKAAFDHKKAIEKNFAIGFQKFLADQKLHHNIHTMQENSIVMAALLPLEKSKEKGCFNEWIKGKKKKSLPRDHGRLQIDDNHSLIKSNLHYNFMPPKAKNKHEKKQIAAYQESFDFEQMALAMPDKSLDFKATKRSPSKGLGIEKWIVGITGGSILGASSVIFEDDQVAENTFSSINSGLSFVVDKFLAFSDYLSYLT